MENLHRGEQMTLPQVNIKLLQFWGDNTKMFQEPSTKAKLTTKKISRHTWKEISMLASSLGCQFFFEDNAELRIHLATHSRFVCKQCEISTTDYDLFLNHS